MLDPEERKHLEENLQLVEEAIRKISSPVPQEVCSLIRDGAALEDILAAIDRARREEKEAPPPQGKKGGWWPPPVEVLTESVRALGQVLVELLHRSH